MAMNNRVLPIILLIVFIFLPSKVFAASPPDTSSPDANRIRLKKKNYGYFFSNSRWPSVKDNKTIIFVCWEKNALAKFPKEVQWVQSAVTESWETYSRVEFRGWKACVEGNYGLRIVEYDDGDEKHAPQVKKFGKNLDGVSEGMTLNFTFNTWKPWKADFKTSENQRELAIRSIAVHEFGHALGFAHEQDRADEPGECAEKTDTKGKDLVYLTPYDINSVMNYCNPKYSNGGNLSKYDIESVQQEYGSPE